MNTFIEGKREDIHYSASRELISNIQRKIKKQVSLRNLSKIKKLCSTESIIFLCFIKTKGDSGKKGNSMA